MLDAALALTDALCRHDTLVSRCILGNCLEVLPTLAPGSIDLVICDLPYGVTANRWDTPLDLEALWVQLLRAAKRNAAFIFTATQPFATTLISSRPGLFRYDLVWQKTNPGNPFLAKHQPLRDHENLLVFFRERPSYTPLMEPCRKDTFRPNTIYKTTSRSTNFGLNPGTQPHRQDVGLRYPRTVRFIPNEARQKSLHPTQKPVALLEWIIKTYSNPGDVILVTRPHRRFGHHGRRGPAHRSRVRLHREGPRLL